jgi:solute carrier family 35 (UDP-xylose/UDP-N-acetylglucosamine transporter), member B4
MARTKKFDKIPAEMLKTLGFISVKEWLLVLLFIFSGCCSNVFALESLIKSIPSSGHIITLSQFIFVSLAGLTTQLELSAFYIPKLKTRKVPIKNWGVMVMLFWSVSVLNNYALGYRIGMPLHIIFRSGGLLVSMVVGFTFFNRSFTITKIFAVILVTIGVVVSSFASAQKTGIGQDSVPLSEFIIGKDVNPYPRNICISTCSNNFCISRSISTVRLWQVW